MSGEYACYGRTWTFSASRNCVQILTTWGHAKIWGESCGSMGLRISSLCNCVRCPLTYASPYHNPTATMGQVLCSQYAIHLPSAQHSWHRYSSLKGTLEKCGHRRWAFSHCSWLPRRTAVRSRPWWGRRACRWASLRLFLTVCAYIL
jgi:hypothetical protein